MAKGKDKQPVFMVRKGLALMPATDMDAQQIEAIGQNQLVRVEIRQERSIARLRAYWAMLNEVVAATECASSAERLHEALKLELGIVEYVEVGQWTVAVPGSIAFDKMAESEMASYFQRAEEFLARTYEYQPAAAEPEAGTPSKIAPAQEGPASRKPVPASGSYRKAKGR